jgi:hypothetical protein
MALGSKDIDVNVNHQAVEKMAERNFPHLKPSISAFIINEN